MGFVFTVVHARVCLSKFDSAIKCALKFEPATRDPNQRQQRRQDNVSSY